jgi:hypothetical protein
VKYNLSGEMWTKGWRTTQIAFIKMGEWLTSVEVPHTSSSFP